MINTLFYGGWWKPVHARKEQESGYADIIYTSNTSSVVEAIELSDLDKSHMVSESFNYSNENDYAVSVITLPTANTESILSIKNESNEDIAFNYVEGEDWITLHENLSPGSSAEIEYQMSLYPDMVITNWDSSKGNYIFYNTFDDTGISLTGMSAEYHIYPNPFDNVLNIKSEKSTAHSFRVYDSRGQQAKRDSFEDDHLLKTDDWKKGVYFIEITDQERNTTVAKVVKR
jgi:hypothetical protein